MFIIQGGLFFSIVLPTLNAEKNISRTFESILQQTHNDWELLILDGGSTDETLAIIETYLAKDKRIGLSSKEDKGIYDAMNKGINMAKGEWLYFMGSDDELFSHSVLEEIFHESINNSDLIYGNVLFKHCKKIYSGESSIERLIGQQISICHQAIFYRKCVFDLLGNYNTDYFIHADYDFNVKCFEEPSIRKKYINRIIALYNELGTSGHMPNKDSFHDHLTIHYLSRYASAFEFFRKAKAFEQELDTIKNSSTYKLARRLAHRVNFLRSLLRKQA